MTNTAPEIETTPVVEADRANDGFPWEMAGGAALLLIAGGAGYVLMRRRRSDGTAIETASYTAPAVAAERQPTAPAATAALQPTLRSTPHFAAAPHGSMGRHEAMAMAGPTPDNPFLTLKKRLKCARFHDRMERMEYEALLSQQTDRRREPVSAWEIAHRPAPTTQEVYRPAPAPSARGLKPGFARG